MIFEQGHLYHIYNQGNNRQKTFFKKENYYFFLNKINAYVLPYADIIAWCLMPNHFHLMIWVHTLEFSVCEKSKAFSSSEGFNSNSKRTINSSVGLLLRSYTRAINNQEKMSGSLFRNPTKAECLTKSDGVTPSFYNTTFGTKINAQTPEKDYPQVCFNYIHNNPVQAGLVGQPEDWEFSSYRDYCNLRKGKLVNRNRAEEFGLKIETVKPSF